MRCSVKECQHKTRTPNQAECWRISGLCPEHYWGDKWQFRQEEIGNE